MASADIAVHLAASIGVPAEQHGAAEHLGMTTGQAEDLPSSGNRLGNFQGDTDPGGEDDLGVCGIVAPGSERQLHLMCGAAQVRLDLRLELSLIHI